MEPSEINPPDDFKSKDDEAFYEDCIKEFSEETFNKWTHTPDIVREALDELDDKDLLILGTYCSCHSDSHEPHITVINDMMIGRHVRKHIINELTKNLDEYAREHIDMSGYEESARERATYNEE